MLNNNDVDYALNVRDVEELRDATNIGDRIKFITYDFVEHKKTHIVERMENEVIGTVKEKYPYIFRLDNGKTYTWNQYALGYIY